MRTASISFGFVVVGILAACSSSGSHVSSDDTLPATGDGGPPSVQSPSSPEDGGLPDAAPPCVPKPTPDFPADVDVVVRAQKGPHGATPALVDRRLYGMNIADWRPQDYTPVMNPKFHAYLKALGPGILRWPAGHRGQHYNWSRVAGQGGDWTLTPAAVDAFVALAKSVDAKPLLAINQKTGTIEAAKDLIQYVNVEKGYGVEWVHIGNEPDHTDGLTSDPESYGDRLAQFADAIREVDPNIKVVAPEIMTGAHIGGINGNVDWMGRILARVGTRANGISWHYYPLDSGQSSPTSSATMSVAHLFQESASDWPPAGLAFDDIVMPSLHAMAAQHSPGAEVWITEFAEDPGPGAGFGLSDRLVGALWAGDALGRYAEYAPGAVMRWLFKSGPEHGYNLIDSADAPRPAYGAYWLYAKYMGNRFVETESTALTEISARAALTSDGALTVVLVNKTLAPKRVRVAVEGYCANQRTDRTLEGGGSFEATTFTIEGQELDDVKATSGIAGTTVADPNDVAMPPASMRLITYRP